MADGTGRSEGFGQVLIKAGVPLVAAALTAFFYVRRSSTVKVLDEDDHSVDLIYEENDVVEDPRNVALVGLVDRIKELQLKEEELEERFERYQSMKECEGVFLEIENMLHLEMERVEYLEKEVSSIESGVRMTKELEVYVMNLFQQVDNLKQENRRLRKKAKKYFRKSKEGIRVIGAQKFRIREFEAVIKRSCDEVEKGNYVVNKMAEEIGELESVVDDLRKEKMELSDKLEVAEASLTRKHEDEMITMGQYKHIITELQKMQNEYTAEVNELVQLRWTNACLRRRLMQQDDLDLAVGSSADHPFLQLDLIHELDKLEMERGNSNPEVTTHRKKSLMKKLKNLVEESLHLNPRMSSTIKAKKGDVKSYGRHFSSDWVDEHVHGRKSFSSA